MFFGTNFLGVSNFITVVLPTAYSKIKFNGEGKIGMIHLVSEILTTEELDAIDVEETPEFSDTTVMLATFDSEDTSAGNVTGVLSIEKWLIYRRELTESSFTKLAELSSDVTSFIDYTVESGKTYKYQVYPQSETVMGNALETGFTEVDFDSYYLIGEEDNIVYRFQLESKMGRITNNTDVSFIETTSKYPTQVITSDLDYDKATVTALYGDYAVATGFEQTNEMLQDLKDFINNGKSKIFKSSKGEMWRVNTTNFSKGNWGSSYIPSQPYEMSFDWVETGTIL